MSQVRLVDEYYHFFYDPYVFGLREDYWRKYSGGSLVGINGKIRIRSTSTNTTALFMMGTYDFKMTIPAAPTAGDSKIWGLYSKAYGNRNAVYFFISGSSLYVRSYGDLTGVPEQSTIAWDSDWTNSPTSFEIRWQIDSIEFWIGNGTNKVRVATHETVARPKQVLMPLYFSNGDDSAMDINYL